MSVAARVRSDDPTAAPVWSQVPRRPAVGAVGPPGAGAELLAVFVAVVGPTTRALSLPGNTPALTFEVVGAVVVASLVLARLSDRWWPLRIAVAVGAGAALFGSQGKLIALWVPAGLLLADWAIRRRRTLPFLRPPPPSAAAPVTVLALVGAYRGRALDASVLLFLPLVAAAVVTASAAWGGPLHRAIERGGAWLSRVVALVTARVAFTVLGLAIVVVPWTLQRLLRIDPLVWTSPTGSGWIERIRRDLQPRDPWAREASRRHTSPWVRVREALPALILVAVAVLGYRLVDRVRAPDRYSSDAARALGVVERKPGEIPAAQKGQDWYSEYYQDMGWVTDDRVAWLPLEQYRFRDVHTRYVNVVDGSRVTWAPPVTDRPRLTVWLYGGSTIFGMDQRDDHTIASELARTAHAAGFDLDVVNRGVNGQMHWMEANRFAWDLTVDDPPDLVVFYDGFNEMWGARQLNDFELGDSRQPLDPMIADIEEQLAETRGDPPAAPPDGELVDRAVPKTEDPAVIARLAVRRYERSRQMSAATAAANDIPVEYFWQPSRHSRPPVDGEPIADDYSERTNTEADDVAASLVTDDVTDLRDVFDDVDRPLFTDDAHHNEYGARLVAQAMFASLRPQLEALS